MGEGARVVNLLWMQCFVRAVETGSFSAVARELQMGQPNVSRHVLSLEEHLGVRLLNRTTRKLSMTPEGARYYEDARKALDAIAEAESVARGDDVPRGLLRISCTASLEARHVRPLIRGFLDLHPAVEIEMHLSDDRVDLVEEGIDFAIRSGALKSSGLHARRIGVSERACLATPAYLERHPEPRVPRDLQSHDCIQYTRLASGNVWTFNGEPVEVRGRYRVNSLEGVRAALLDGMGIGLAPVWMFADELRRGTIRAVLRDFPVPPADIQLIFPARRLVSRRASMLMASITAAFAAEPTLNAGSLERVLAAAP
jgi:LysR family transcriptional regulator for bpeEF and oprC